MDETEIIMLSDNKPISLPWVNVPCFLLYVRELDCVARKQIRSSLRIGIRHRNEASWWWLCVFLYGYGSIYVQTYQMVHFMTVFEVWTKVPSSTGNKLLIWVFFAFEQISGWFEKQGELFMACISMSNRTFIVLCRESIQGWVIKIVHFIQFNVHELYFNKVNIKVCGRFIY